MIKINKSPPVPKSLLLPADNRGKVNKTHERRVELIAAQAYIDDANHNNRYKHDDIKKALKKIYNNKCAFCEQIIEQLHVEHYRPKNVYYWLAYSWDNLLLACPTCNGHKRENFEIEGLKAEYRNDYLERIHSLSADLNILETPKMINPEVTDPSGNIAFTKEGSITSPDPRMKYTIEKCKIDRGYLNDERRKILQEFIDIITSEFVLGKTIADQRCALEVITRKFIRDAHNKESEYIAFRKYALDNNWLNDAVKAITN